LIGKGLEGIFSFIYLNLFTIFTKSNVKPSIYDEPYMRQTHHLNRYANKRYANLLFHADIVIDDQLIFVANSILSELNDLAEEQKCTVDIIHIDIDEETKIPAFQLCTSLNISEHFLESCHVRFFTAWVEKFFATA
jgi:hypothetical protein